MNIFFYVRSFLPITLMLESKQSFHAHRQKVQKIDHFCVCVKTSLDSLESCETINMKMCSVYKFIFMQIKLIFISKVWHLDSFWNRGTHSLTQKGPIVRKRNKSSATKNSFDLLLNSQKLYTFNQWGDFVFPSVKLKVAVDKLALVENVGLTTKDWFRDQIKSFQAPATIF